MKQLHKGFTLCAAAGALLMVCTKGNAQTDTTMSATMSTTATTSAAPMAVSGKVVRYYVDRSGYVTAADVQTADGVRMVRFSPSMAQRMVTTYPVGADATFYVSSSPWGSASRYDVVAVGPDMPAPTSMMMPYMISDLDMLRSMPYIVAGSRQSRTTGELTGYVTDPQTNEVLALILDKDTLVRVPLENRLVQASPAPEGITTLIKGADVQVVGYPEAPRYGAISPFTNRIVATGIAVNGNTVGPLGFGRVMSGNTALINFNNEGYMEYGTSSNANP